MRNKFTKENIQGKKLWVMTNKEIDTPIVFVSEEARMDLIKWFHDNLNHVGSERTAGTM